MLGLGHPQQPLLPLLRLRIEVESDQQFLNSRDLHVHLGLENKVANPDDIIKLVRKRCVQEKIKANVDEEAFDAVFSMGVCFFYVLKNVRISYAFLIVD